MKKLSKNIKYFLFNFVASYIGVYIVYYIYICIDSLFHKYEIGVLGALLFMSIFYLGFSVIFSLLLSLFSLRVKSTIKIWQHKLLIFVIGIINILILTLKIDIRWDFPFGDNLILSMFLNSAIIYAIIIGIYIKIRQKYFKKLQKL